MPESTPLPQFFQSLADGILRSAQQMVATIDNVQTAVVKAMAKMDDAELERWFTASKLSARSRSVLWGQIADRRELDNG